MIPSIADTVQLRLGELSPVERKLARVLLERYPSAGLETLAQWAQQAGVSSPSVLRLVQKLGFDSFPLFQDALRRELQERLQSPLERHRSATSPAQDQPFLQGYADRLARCLQDTARLTPPQDFADVAQALADPRRQILLVGGRLTHALATYMAQLLRQLRPQVQLLSPAAHDWAADIASLRRGDVVVVFDIRRYNEALLPLAQQSADRRARVVLLTDPWRSPVSPHAWRILVGHTTGESGWDSIAGLLLLVDALVAALGQSHWDALQERIQQIESVRQQTG
ncbi:MurR/RpiR family transcriptional regulator [Amphibiibacter pelophylacis]|uniref:MurR/RpiR family transcriptional regulator n=1 Tax=Amphibiibacter pelophylacis TaxID=1799477 RepID=A0ACC6P451_9BURK